MSEQYTDASNSINSNLSGVIGLIPSYDVLDISLAYKYQKFKIESGINNVLNNAYFTRRATGYPGPGIIPSPPKKHLFNPRTKILIKSYYHPFLIKTIIYLIYKTK